MNQLPKLPVPKLEETSPKFLQWCQPLLTEEEYQATATSIQNFINTPESKVLQQKLQDRAQEKNNWLYDYWQESYLGYRSNLPLNSNYFFLLPEITEKEPLKNATMFIAAATQFYKLIQTKKLPQDMQKDIPLCMHEYKYLFATSRIPQKNKDQIKTATISQHIIVLIKGQIYRLQVLDADLNPLTTIYQDLKYIQEHAENGSGIGAFTAWKRDKWADAQIGLKSLGNDATLDIVNQALFAVCLDEKVPDNLDQQLELALHANFENRWFDKSLQFIFNTNGSIAFNIEHTMLDALPVLKLLNFIINHLDTSHTLSTPKQTPQNHSVQLLEFKLNTSIQQQLAMAKKDFATASSDIYTKAFEFTGFGSNLIKKAQVSPDAFMQIAFQLTYESIFHEFGTIYESVSTRQFSLARTEAMRSLTSELVAFIKGFKNQNISQTVKVELFRKAAKAHIDRIMECQNGLGVERHFFGLAQIAATSLPSTTPTLNAIFQSPGWQKLKYDKMSSSNCGSRDISFFGYGPTTLDGLGIGYTVLPEKIQICLTAHQKLQAQTKAFHQKLSQILKDLLELLA